MWAATAIEGGDTHLPTLSCSQAENHALHTATTHEHLNRTAHPSYGVALTLHSAPHVQRNRHESVATLSRPHARTTRVHSAGMALGAAQKPAVAGLNLAMERELGTLTSSHRRATSAQSVAAKGERQTNAGSITWETDQRRVHHKGYNSAMVNTTHMNGSWGRVGFLFSVDKARNSMAGSMGAALHYWLHGLSPGHTKSARNVCMQRTYHDGSWWAIWPR